MGNQATLLEEVFLPDFCGTRRVLAVLVISELVALVVTLAGYVGDGSFWQRLFLMSVYLQWIGICSAAALCLIRQYAMTWDSRLVAALCYLALLAVTFAVSEVTYTAGRYTGIAPLVDIIGHGDFLLRNLGICAIVAALALRYFWLRDAWRRQARAESEARYLALQARIHPHFLFNCLNSIASLVAVKPEHAEAAIEDLSELLRANLGEAGNTLSPLQDELAMTQAYTRIESLRLGDRLKLEWNIDDRAREWLLPPLCLQPLVENAVDHGIAQLTEGGTIKVTADVRDHRLVLEVSNPVPTVIADSHGQRLALDNIRQRFALRYGQDAHLNTSLEAGKFVVRLVLPRPAEGAS